MCYKHLVKTWNMYCGDLEKLLVISKIPISEYHCSNILQGFPNGEGDSWIFFSCSQNELVDDLSDIFWVLKPECFVSVEIIALSQTTVPV